MFHVKHIKQERGYKMATKRTRLQSQNKQEYDRVRRNILARMRYREKQGFKVDYTTRPQTLAKPTKRDIERLKKMQVGINKSGDIQVFSPKQKAHYGKIDIRKINPSNLYIKNEPQYTGSQRPMLETSYDYIDLIISKLEGIKHKSQNLDYEDFSHPMRGHTVIEIASAYMNAYEECIQAIEDSIDRVGSERVNEYYKSEETTIASYIAEFVAVALSTKEQVESCGSQIRDKLIVK